MKTTGQVYAATFLEAVREGRPWTECRARAFMAAMATAKERAQ